MDDTMPDQPAAPALTDADLRETLDLLSTVVASVSDRMDSQTQAIDRLTKTAAETRQAAFAARSQTDPEIFAEQINEHIRGTFGAAVNAQTGLVRLLGEEIRRLGTLESEHEQVRRSLLTRIQSEKHDVERWKRRIPFIAIFGLVLALALGIALPRFAAHSTTACRIIGGQMLASASGNPACVLFR